MNLWTLYPNFHYKMLHHLVSFDEEERKQP